MSNKSAGKSSYFIYTRRSTDDPSRQQNTIQYQREQCLRYAERGGLMIANLHVADFCDSGLIEERHTAFKTARLTILRDGVVRYSIERPKFMQLVQRLDRGECAGVIALCWDRLSRNPHDDAIIKDLIARGVDVRFVQATYEKSSAGALHMDIDGMFAAHYSRVVSEKIRAANGKLRSEGRRTNRPPIGYLSRGGAATNPIDPERAPIVRALFKRYATGAWSLRELARWAAAQGLTTQPQRPRGWRATVLNEDGPTPPATARPVSAKTLEHLLANPFYAGFITYRGELLPGQHQPLVSHALFESVQAALHGRSRTVHYVERAFHTYRGLLRCSCGRSYSPYVKKGHIYYRARCRTGCTNSAVNLGEADVDRMVVNVLSRIALTDDEVRELQERAPMAFKTMATQDADEEAARAREVQRLGRDYAFLEKNKLTLLQEGVYDAASYQTERHRLTSRLGELKQPAGADRVRKAEERLTAMLNITELLKKANVSYFRASGEKRRAWVVSAVSELVVRDQDIAEVRAKEPFAALLKRHDAGSCGVDFLLSELGGAVQHKVGSEVLTP